MNDDNIESALSLSTLPIEILYKIFLYLGPQDLIRMERVSHYLQTIARDNRLWKRIHAIFHPSFDYTKCDKDWRIDFLLTFSRLEVIAHQILFHLYQRNLGSEDCRPLTHNILWLKVGNDLLINRLFYQQPSSQRLLNRIFQIEQWHYAKKPMAENKRAALFNLAIVCNQPAYVALELSRKYATFSNITLSYKPHHTTNHQQTPLHLAAARGYLDIVMQLLNTTCPVDEKDSNGMTPLMGAASGGYLLIVRALVNAGADIHARDNDHQNVLRHGARNKHTAVVRFLLQHGARIDNPYGCYRSELSKATCDADNADIIKLFIRYGAIIDSSVGGYSPLSLSVMHGHYQNFMLLLNAGADVNGNTKECYGSPLFAAAQEGELTMFLELIKRGAAIDFPLKGSRELLIGYGEQVNELKIFQYYIDESIQLGEPDSAIVMTPFDIAVLRKRSAIVEELSHQIPDISKLTTKARVLAMIAVMNQDLPSLKVLGRLGVDFQHQDHSGKRPLDAAQETCRRDIAHYIIRCMLQTVRSELFSTFSIFSQKRKTTALEPVVPVIQENLIQRMS